jgi:hypothetical protein
MRPADQPEPWVEDDRDSEVEAATSVEDEIPGDDPVAIGSLGRGQGEAREPALDVGRADGQQARFGG